MQKTRRALAQVVLLPVLGVEITISYLKLLRLCFA